MKIITSTETFLEDITEKDKTLVVVTAPSWCPPCKTMEPIVDEIAEEFIGINVVILDPDAHGELAKAMGVQSLPTFIGMKDGNEVIRFIGAMPKEKMMVQFITALTEHASEDD